MDGGGRIVNVYVGDGSCVQADTSVRGASNGHVPGRKSVPIGEDFPRGAHDEALRRRDATFDPHRMLREFPARWRVYLHENFRDIPHVCRAFNVTDKAARRWWNGEGGANAAYTGMAMAMHPVQAARTLYRESVQ